MAKITADNLKDAGFVPEMFGKDATDFDAWLSGVIDLISARLSGRIGAGLYAATDERTAQDVTEAERQLCLAELWQRRITWKLGNAQGDNVSCKYETESRDTARDEAVELISRVTGGDFASGTLESSHFDAADIWESPYA